MTPTELRRHRLDYPFVVVVSDEECPNCGTDLKGDERVHVKARNSEEWEAGSANPPFGNVTLDPMSDDDPDDEVPDLRMSTDQVDVTCAKCGHGLASSVNRE